MLKTFVMAILCSTLLLGVACSEDENGDGSSEREDFIQSVEDQIEELRAELEQLREEIADSDAGAELEQQADALEGRINDAENELAEIREASDDEWQDLRDSLDATLNDAGDLAEEIGGEIGIN